VLLLLTFYIFIKEFFMTSLVNNLARCVVIALSIFYGIAVAQPASQPKPKAAVYIKGNPPGRDVLSMAVNTFLIKTGMYQMIAVDAIDNVLAQEHKRQMGGSVSDSEIAKLGRDAGAQYICVVERTELDGISYVTTSIVSVQSKIAEFSDMKELPRGERVINVIERQINAMLGISVAEVPAVYEKTPSTATDAIVPPGNIQVQQGSDALSSNPSVGKPERKPKRKKNNFIIGIGGVFTSDFGGGVAWDEPGRHIELAMPYYGIGTHLFLDLGPINIFIDYYSSGWGKWQSVGVSSDSLPNMSRLSHTNIGVFGKFPTINIKGRVTLFPLYGVEWERYLDDSAAVLKYANGNKYAFDGKDERPDANTLNSVWGKIGGGIDIGDGNPGVVFLRVEALYGIRTTANKFEENYESYFGGSGTSPMPGRGLTVRINLCLGAH
jgi:hypothetical protein